MVWRHLRARLRDQPRYRRHEDLRDDAEALTGFFIHSGDTIYADCPIPAEIKLPDGSIWRNLTTEAKSKVAETLDEVRGNYLYKLMDENVRRFNSEVPQIWQWDDHEVLNNWPPGKDLTGNQSYKEKNIATLAGRARRAFVEHSPIRMGASIFRRIGYGPLLDVFVIDMRTYRVVVVHHRHRALELRQFFRQCYRMPPTLFRIRRPHDVQHRRRIANA